MPGDAIRKRLLEWCHSWCTECHVVGFHLAETCHLAPLWSQASCWVTSSWTNTGPAQLHGHTPAIPRTGLPSPRLLQPYKQDGQSWPIHPCVRFVCFIHFIKLKPSPVWPTTACAFIVIVERFSIKPELIDQWVLLFLNCRYTLQQWEQPESDLRAQWEELVEWYALLLR